MSPIRRLGRNGRVDVAHLEGQRGGVGGGWAWPELGGEVRFRVEGYAEEAGKI